MRPPPDEVRYRQTWRGERPQLGYRLAAARNYEALATLDLIHDVAAVVPQIANRHISHGH